MFVPKRSEGVKSQDDEGIEKKEIFWQGLILYASWFLYLSKNMQTSRCVDSTVVEHWLCIGLISGGEVEGLFQEELREKTHFKGNKTYFISLKGNKISIVV